MKKYESPDMSFFFAESKDIITVSFGGDNGIGAANDIISVDMSDYMN